MKTIINLLLGVTILGTLCTACRRDGDAHEWTGRVLEFGTDKPIAGATVYLLEGSSEWWGQSSEYRIDSTESAGDGSFRFSYERVGGRYYRITGGADRYYPGEAFLERTSSTRANLVLDPYAWALIKILCLKDKTESLRIQNDHCWRDFSGVSLNDTNVVVCPKRGNWSAFITVFYQPHINLGLPAQTFDEKIFFAAHDTTVVEVRFE